MTRRHAALRRGWSTVSLLTGALVVCALVLAGQGASADTADDPADPADLRLPTVVNAPGVWSTEENGPGPVAAIGLADRIIAEGMFGERHSLCYFATSALDGSSSWLDLPGLDPAQASLAGSVTLSPDGRWIGWVRTGNGRMIKGWSLRDTTTGRVRNLDVEGHGRVRPTVAELAFSGDSRYLLTSFAVPGEPKRGHRDHQFVAWGVEDGTPTVLEEPGFWSLPNLGHAEQGVVWSRNQKVIRADPRTGLREVTTLPRSVWMASWAPNDAAFAYIGRDRRKKGEPVPQERLFVGATPATAERMIALPTSSPIGEALAWRDATHVVVGDHRRHMLVVDITDGSYETIDMAGSGDQINTPILATDLWAEPLREPAEPSGTSDPRRLWRWAGLLLFLALLATGVSLLRRADRAAEDSAQRTPNDKGNQS